MSSHPWARASLAGILVLLMLPTWAQKHRVRFIQDGDIPDRWIQPIEVGSVQQVPRARTELVASLQARGHLEASIDSCSTEDTRNTVCQVHVGPVYQWARLTGHGIPAEIASEANFRERLFGGKPIDPSQLARLFEDLLVRCENNGHPFARVWLDSLVREGAGLSAVLHLDQGPLVLVDSILVKGTARTNMRYLRSHIGIRPGDPYNESLVRGLEVRLRELPFVTQRMRPYVQFTPEKTKLYLFLDARKASSINGVLGIQPDPATGKVTLTGDIDLRLRNALRRGEAIALNWRRLQDQTQDLRIGFNLPFVLNTPFGIDANLKLFKRDTTFLEVAARGALEYLLGRGDKVSVFVNSKSSDRLGSNQVASPGLADVDLLSYGLAIERERFDYRLNPRRGHALQLEASAGRKRTSTAVYSVSSPSTSDAAPEIRTIQYELNGRAIAHLPIRGRSTLRFAAQGGWMVNDDLYQNELYRIGGARSMRGVDEASIFCSSFAIGTLEYRFVFEENSNFFAFIDQGWWENVAGDQLLTDAPLGSGVGATFETKAGLFSITYALARQFDDPVLLRGGKVHFGFVSLF